MKNFRGSKSIQIIVLNYLFVKIIYLIVRLIFERGEQSAGV